MSQQHLSPCGVVLMGAMAGACDGRVGGCNAQDYKEWTRTCPPSIPAPMMRVLPNSSPMRLTWSLPRSAATSHLEEQGFARDRTKHCKVLALVPMAIFTCSFCLIPSHVSSRKRTVVAVVVVAAVSNVAAVLPILPPAATPRRPATRAAISSYPRPRRRRRPPLFLRDILRRGATRTLSQLSFCVSRSSDIFADDWLDKEYNSQLCDVLFPYLLGHNVSCDPPMGRSDFDGKE